MEEEKERNLKLVCLKLNTLKVEGIATPALGGESLRVQICGGMPGSSILCLSKDFDVGIKD